MTEIRTADGIERVVLAQAGGLDTAIAIPWLADTYRAEIIAVTIDLGQRKEWLEEVRDRALANGALRAHVVDVRDEFARDYLVRGLKAGLFGDDPAATTETLARPIIAQTLVSIAGIEEARAVAHGDRGGSGGAALGRAVRALDPALTVLAVPASMSLPRDDRAGVNGVAMPWLDLVESIQILARAHGVGPSPLVALDVAHRALEQETLSNDAERFGSRIKDEYIRMLHDGSWFSEMRHALDAYVDKIQERVGGVVRLKLFKGACTVVECQVATPSKPTIIPVAKG
jgi:argininosuccinate synthase